MKNDLETVCDQILVDWLPAKLKARLDEALAKGAKPRHLLTVVRRQAGRKSLTYQAAEAYLEGKGAK